MKYFFNWIDLFLCFWVVFKMHMRSQVTFKTFIISDSPLKCDFFVVNNIPECNTLVIFAKSHDPHGFPVLLAFILTNTDEHSFVNVWVLTQYLLFDVLNLFKSVCIFGDVALFSLWWWQTIFLFTVFLLLMITSHVFFVTTIVDFFILWALWVN